LLAVVEQSIEDIPIEVEESLHAALEEVEDDAKTQLLELPVFSQQIVSDHEVKPFAEIVSDEVEQLEVARRQKGGEQLVDGFDYQKPFACARVESFKDQE
jgi:hypothetical protein